jgi:hypothetical protein
MAFDSKAEIQFDAVVAATDFKPQPVTLRWPTDEEWAARTRARKIIIKRLGRGVSETIAPDPCEADVKLYQTIALNGAPAMTAAEAVKVLESIGVSDVIDVHLDGAEVEVEMIVMTGRVKHHMRMPSADQVVVFRRAAFRVLDLPYNTQELRVNADAGARLYDQCGGNSPDYASGVPAPHKDAAMRAVIEFVDRNLGPRGDDPNL